MGGLYNRYVQPASHVFSIAHQPLDTRGKSPLPQLPTRFHAKNTNGGWGPQYGIISRTKRHPFSRPKWHPPYLLRLGLRPEAKAEFNPTEISFASSAAGQAIRSRGAVRDNSLGRVQLPSTWPVRIALHMQPLRCPLYRAGDAPTIQKQDSQYPSLRTILPQTYATASLLYAAPCPRLLDSPRSRQRKEVKNTPTLEILPYGAFQDSLPRSSQPNTTFFR